MQFYFILVSLASFFLWPFQQPKTNNWECPCAQIGIDNNWADSNKVTCYLLPVPRDYDDPAKGSFRVAVAVAKSTNGTSASPLLYLHGGPGLSTLTNFKRYLEEAAWREIRQQQDLVFFDYRGTGFSEPTLCKEELDSLMAFRKTNPDRNVYFSRELEAYKSCRGKLPSQNIDLATFTSRQMAADADMIRKTLKVDKWDLYGVSYGTFIGLSYVKNFPEGIRSVILDSPFPPNTPWLDFVRPFDTAFAYLQSKLLLQPSTAKKFPDLRKDFARAVERLNKKPARINGINYYGDEFAWNVYTAMVKAKLVYLVPLAIQEVANGNDSILPVFKKIGSMEAFGTHHPAQEWAVICYENRTKDPRALQDSLNKNYPELKPFNLGYNVGLCDVFRPELPDPDIFQPVHSNLPVLILSGGFDPATPPIFGAVAKKTLPNSTHIIIPQASHAVLHFNECMYKTVAAFLQHPNQKPVNDCLANVPDVKFAVGNIERVLSKYH